MGIDPSTVKIPVLLTLDGEWKPKAIMGMVLQTEKDGKTKRVMATATGHLRFESESDVPQPVTRIIMSEILGPFIAQLPVQAIDAEVIVGVGGYFEIQTASLLPKENV